MRANPRALADGAVAGIAWGIAAYLLGRNAFGAGIWPGILASPLIGTAVAALTQSLFENASGWKRSATALLSLYGGGILFALVVGICDAISKHSPARSALEPILDAQLAMLWGITVTGFFVMLWPLAYFTHFVIEWRSQR